MSEGATVRRLLYVEDNEDNLYMLQLWFDVLGEYEILSARDGAAGIAMAAAARPDLILMDLNLPEIDGWEATRRLKAAPATRDIPIILVSVKDTPLDKRWGLQQGAAAYLAKPFPPNELVESVSSLIA